MASSGDRSRLKDYGWECSNSKDCDLQPFFITIGPDRAKQDVNKQETLGDLAQIQSVKIWQSDLIIIYQCSTFIKRLESKSFDTANAVSRTRLERLKYISLGRIIELSKSINIVRYSSRHSSNLEAAIRWNYHLQTLQVFMEGSRAFLFWSFQIHTRGWRKFLVSL